MIESEELEVHDMSVMVLLASKDGSKVATVACPKCGRISRQILRDEYKSSPIAEFRSSHTCPLCETTSASSSSAERAKYSGSYARYTAQGEQSYNSDIRTTYTTIQSRNSQAPNATPIAAEKKDTPPQHITEQQRVPNVSVAQPKTTTTAIADAAPKTQASTLDSVIQDTVSIPKAIPVVDGGHSNKDVLKRKAEHWKKQLLEGDKEWQVIQEAHVCNQKVNAGAGRNVKRVVCKIEKTTPFYINTNVDTIQIKLHKESLIFLPDKVFIIRKGKVGLVNYEDVSILVSQTRFIESDPVPRDAVVVGSTWQYVNKNGTPDRRYSNNRQLPICQYGVVYLTSGTGLNIEMQFSNVNKTQDFEELIR